MHEVVEKVNIKGIKIHHYMLYFEPVTMQKDGMKGGRNSYGEKI